MKLGTSCEMTDTLVLSREFAGHEQDVRCLATFGNTIFSGSRDGTVREWQTDKTGTTELQLYRSHRGFVNALAYHDGYIISGAQDATINMTKPGTAEPEFTLVGHTANVCALDVSKDGKILSGSWDGTAKLWHNGKCIETMEGHEGAVWAVLHTDHGVLTGGADKTIRLWKNGRQTKNFPAGKDCIRALALHPLGFVSAGNDSIIRIHTFDGEIVQSLEGHESFIYSLTTTNEGDILSVGEDRSLRSWSNGSLVQTITHPALSVWSVLAMDNGDVVTGSSDAIVRVFTTAKERRASPEDLKLFEDKVAASNIPAQTTNIPNNLPGLEALGRPGEKEGEVKMIRTSPDLVEAHQWSGGVWVKIGEVMGATSKKVSYEGKEWDFVFDVDIAEGQPPLKLPYNTEENPYEAANRFIAKYELDEGYQGQIVKFIETNTGGVPLGVSQTQVEETPKATALTPQTVFLTMVAGNVTPILQKLKSLDAESESGLSISTLDGLDISKPSSEQISILLQLCCTSPRSRRFPALDLLRLCIPKLPDSVPATELLEVVLQASEMGAGAIEDKTREINIMLSLRCLANLFSTTAGLDVIRKEVDRVLDMVSPVHYPQNRNISLALSTYLLNSATLAYKEQSSLSAINLLDPIQKLIRDISDSEICYRALIALGTLLRVSDDVIEVAKDVYDVGTTLRRFDESKEHRIKDVIFEIRSIMK